jgi:hypothetical protein
MGTKILQNRTTFIRCDKDENHPFSRIPANLFKLDGYQLAIMSQILSNSDDWNIVKKEIRKRIDFPRQKFNDAWKSLIDLGYISVKRIQGGYHYTIHEDPCHKSTITDIYNFTSTRGRSCAGGILTTINNNYNREITITTDGTCNESQFNDLIELYPTTGTKPDGTSYKLRGNLDKCKKAYADYLKTNVMTHDEIMLALKVELNDRLITGKTNYQPGLLKWIENKSFEKYRGKTLEPVDMGYGTELA